MVPSNLLFFKGMASHLNYENSGFFAGAFRPPKTFDIMDVRDQSIVSVKIIEALDPDYGLYVWPCAKVLAQCIVHQKVQIVNRNIVELGAGTALVGLMAARCGARSVLLTDHSGRGAILQNCLAAAELNDLQHIVSVHGLTWGHFTPFLSSLVHVDLILASDCFYNTQDFEPLLTTIAYLLELNPAAEVWCTYQVRSADRSIEYLLNKWNLRCLILDVDEVQNEIAIACREGTECTNEARSYGHASDNIHHNVTASHEILLLKITRI